MDKLYVGFLLVISVVCVLSQAPGRPNGLPPTSTKKGKRPSRKLNFSRFQSPPPGRVGLGRGFNRIPPPPRSPGSSPGKPLPMVEGRVQYDHRPPGSFIPPGGHPAVLTRDGDTGPIPKRMSKKRPVASAQSAQPINVEPIPKFAPPKASPQPKPQPPAKLQPKPQPQASTAARPNLQPKGQPQVMPQQPAYLSPLSLVQPGPQSASAGGRSASGGAFQATSISKVSYIASNQGSGQPQPVAGKQASISSTFRKIIQPQVLPPRSMALTSSGKQQTVSASSIRLTASQSVGSPGGAQQQTSPGQGSSGSQSVVQTGVVRSATGRAQAALAGGAVVQGGGSAAVIGRAGGAVQAKTHVQGATSQGRVSAGESVVLKPSGPQRTWSSSQRTGSAAGTSERPSGGAPAVGRPSAGAAVGGQPSSGVAAGGKPSGWATAGGRPNTGAAVGGQPSSGVAAGGRPSGGAPAGGRQNIGPAAVGLPSAGAAAGGRPNGWASAGGRPSAGAAGGGRPSAATAVGGRTSGGASVGGRPSARVAASGRPSGGASVGGQQFGSAPPSGPSAGPPSGASTTGKVAAGRGVPGNFPPTRTKSFGASAAGPRRSTSAGPAVHGTMAAGGGRLVGVARPAGSPSTVGKQSGAAGGQRKSGGAAGGPAARQGSTGQAARLPPGPAATSSGKHATGGDIDGAVAMQSGGALAAGSAGGRGTPSGRRPNPTNSGKQGVGVKQQRGASGGAQSGANARPGTKPSGKPAATSASSGASGQGSAAAGGQGATSGAGGRRKGPCNIQPVCGSDGFTYMSECYLWSGITKACDGFCPCSPKPGPSSSSQSSTKTKSGPPPASVKRPGPRAPKSPASGVTGFPGQRVPPGGAGRSGGNQPPRSRPSGAGRRGGRPKPAGRQAIPAPAEKPVCSCPDYYEAVCGTNGVTYQNDCFRRCGYAGFKCQGECPCGPQSKYFMPTSHSRPTIAVTPRMLTGPFETPIAGAVVELVTHTGPAGFLLKFHEKSKSAASNELQFVINDATNVAQKTDKQSKLSNVKQIERDQARKLMSTTINEATKITTTLGKKDLELRQNALLKSTNKLHSGIAADVHIVNKDTTRTTSIRLDNSGSQAAGGLGATTSRCNHCGDGYFPVCGSDGNTYRNPCELSCVPGVNEACKGTCPCLTGLSGFFTRALLLCQGQCDTNYRPVCSVHDHTYDNDCLRQCSYESKACDGECPCPSYDPWYEPAPVTQPPYVDYGPGDGYQPGDGGHNYNHEPSNQPLSTCECTTHDIDPVCTTDGETLWYGCEAICLGKKIACSSECPC